MRETYRIPLSENHKERLVKFYKENPNIDKVHEWIIPLVRSFLDKNNYTEFLDYGCGNGYLGKALKNHTTHEYDPGFEDKSEEPKPCNAVTCVNVLQYCEPGWFKQTLWHLQSVVKERAFICIGLKAKESQYEDGALRTSHIMSETMWRQWIAQFFSVDSTMLIKEKESDIDHAYIVFEVSPLDFTVIPMSPFALR